VQVLVVIRLLRPPPPPVGDCGRAMYKRLNPALRADHKHVRDWVFMAAAQAVQSTIEDIIPAAKAHAAHLSSGTVILPLQVMCGCVPQGTHFALCPVALPTCARRRFPLFDHERLRNACLLLPLASHGGFRWLDRCGLAVSMEMIPRPPGRGCISMEMISAAARPRLVLMAKMFSKKLSIPKPAGGIPASRHGYPQTCALPANLQKRPPLLLDNNSFNFFTFYVT
jgi:hypothetical protein